ncbi:hypothetical protein EXIGLDRAFT_348857 [Exidia glandulosa HHB12029]|uniref:Uncharacterized protein n=1 Tax=Exidia glandulosa HHB12029 TaxID=1314781 RepID=A0A165LFS0_EXIGL|nr:hypothetical protein EXIGLDRAFT_348857 [Exidia glandulosa HHB12029]
MDEDVFSGPPTQDTVPSMAPYPPSTPTPTASASTAARMHGLASTPSQGTIRLSQPMTPMTPHTPGTSLSPEERLEQMINDLPVIRRRYTAERKGNEFKARKIEELQREKADLEREKIALHDRCSALEQQLKDRERELNQARRRLASYEGSSP